MIVTLQPEEFRRSAAGAIVATVGVFDGLHRGHQAIMSQVVARARELRGMAAVLTFDPHPRRVLDPERAPRLMLTREQKLSLLERLGMDAAVVLPFDRALAAMPAEEFVREVLHRRLGAREIFVGADFRFGRGRAGDFPLLERLGREAGVVAHSVAPVVEDGERISASRIRALLAEGKAREARALLGRPFSLIGTVVHGEGRGGAVLVPTANLAPENEFLPERGVYITATRRPAGTILGLTNVGLRPTFGDQRLVVETFLPGFSGDLYGARVELDFLERLRDERKFESTEDLRNQIGRDIEVFERWRAGRVG